MPAIPGGAPPGQHYIAKGACRANGKLVPRYVGIVKTGGEDHRRKRGGEQNRRV